MPPAALPLLPAAAVSSDYAATLDYVCGVFQAASAAGLVVVAAAGNYASDLRGEAQPLQLQLHYHAAFSSFKPRLAWVSCRVRQCWDCSGTAVLLQPHIQKGSLAVATCPTCITQNPCVKSVFISLMQQLSATIVCPQPLLPDAFPFGSNQHGPLLIQQLPVVASSS
jgi:hypothetical protein